ncbi:MAG TPA: dihydroorotase [Desulfobacteraceae bacterium]|nr:dihydroorotase [Desulfobacteraceae bacterium]HPJ66726.1 dihydroorotase [Desulfobacteraceae bacterium]HPQ26913.1 dihydroorotase [Desulfobacteraceae bacterium]
MITLIKFGTLVDPVIGLVEKGDLIIEDEKITGIFPSGAFKEKIPQINIIDAANMLIIPGLIDMHVHLREPGYEYKETVASGSKAAVAGGFTALACMPNTLPPNDCKSVTEFIIDQGKKAGLAGIYPIAAITKGQKGEVLTEFGDIRDAGAVAVSDDGLPVKNSELMRRALEYANFHGLKVISHCEDMSLSSGGVMHEGVISTRIGLPGIPSACEEIMVYREIALAKLTGCPVHIAHVSTEESVDLVRRAKEAGIKVTAETAPHYFSLDHSAVLEYDTNARVNPPLRTPRDVEAIRKGLAEGVIDVIATDHAPHNALEKEVEFDQAASGMIGLETALPLTLELVREGVLGLPEAIAKLSWNPGLILGTGGGGLNKGDYADLAIVDPQHEYVLRKEDIVSKSSNTPFIGKTLKGRNKMTMVKGKIVFPFS